LRRAQRRRIIEGCPLADAPTGPRVLGEAIEYGDLHEILRSRSEELGASRETLDAVSGLQSGYTAKLLSPVPRKAL
jgi:hypothetical protein